MGHVTLTNGVVAPGAPRTDSTAVGPLSQNNIDALNAGTYLFYIFGELNYEDVFGEKHQTDFCFRRDPQSSRARELRHLQLDELIASRRSSGST